MDAGEDDHGKRKRKSGDNPERKRKEFDPGFNTYLKSTNAPVKYFVNIF